MIALIISWATVAFLKERHPLPQLYIYILPPLLLRVSISRMPSICQFKRTRLLLRYIRCALSWSGTVKPFLSQEKIHVSMPSSLNCPLFSNKGWDRRGQSLNLREIWATESCHDRWTSLCFSKSVRYRCGDMLLARRKGLCCFGKSTA